MADDRSLLVEIGPDGLAREAPVIAYTEKIIEEEQLQLKKYIEENYSKMRDVERDLAKLTLELKLTAGPKAGLELLRKKIEIATERIRAAKQKEEQARKVWEAASKALKDEEANKQKLCDDLSSLVQESSSSQFSRLAELKRRVEALNPGRSSSPSVSTDGITIGAVQSSTALDASSVTQILEPVEKEVPHQDSNGKVPTADGPSQLTSIEGDTRPKKKVHFQVCRKGIGFMPKARGGLFCWLDWCRI